MSVEPVDGASFGGRDRIGGYDLKAPTTPDVDGPAFQAWQGSLDRDVCLIVLDPAAADDPDRVRRFRDRGRITSRLAHTHLVSGLDLGTEDGLHFLVTEWAGTRTLADVLAAKGALSERQLLLLTRQLAKGIQAAHRGHVVHGGVTPGRVFITAEGTAKIGGLGCVAPDAARTDAEDAAHAAPEQVAGLPASPASDLFGLGATVYHAATGRPPFAGETPERILAARQQASVAPPRTLAPSLAPEVEEVLVRCLAQDPADRPGSVDEVLDMVEGLLRAGVRAKPPTVQAPTRRGAAGANRGTRGEAPRARRRRRR